MLNQVVAADRWNREHRNAKIPPGAPVPLAYNLTKPQRNRTRAVISNRAARDYVFFNENPVTGSDEYWVKVAAQRELMQQEYRPFWFDQSPKKENARAARTPMADLIGIGWPVDPESSCYTKYRNQIHETVHQMGNLGYVPRHAFNGFGEPLHDFAEYPVKTLKRQPLIHPAKQSRYQGPQPQLENRHNKPGHNLQKLAPPPMPTKPLRRGGL